MRWLKIWKWKIHWQILLAIGLGIAAGVALQWLDPRPRLVALLPEGEEIGHIAQPVVEVEPTGRLAVLATGPREEAPETQTERRLTLQAGDRVVRVGGKKVESAEAFLKLLSRWPDGARVSLTVERNGEEVAARGRVLWSASSPRARALLPLDFLADAFRRLLQMLIQ